MEVNKETLCILPFVKTIHQNLTFSCQRHCINIHKHIWTVYLLVVIVVVVGYMLLKPLIVLQLIIHHLKETNSQNKKHK